MRQGTNDKPIDSMKILREELGTIYLEVPVEIHRANRIGTGENRFVFGKMHGVPVHFIASPKEDGRPELAYDFQVDPSCNLVPLMPPESLKERYELRSEGEYETVFDNEENMHISCFHVGGYGKRIAAARASNERDGLYKAMLYNWIELHFKARNSAKTIGANS